MKSLFKWITTIFVTAILIVFAYSSINGVVAKTTPPNPATTSPSPNPAQSNIQPNNSFCNLSGDIISDESIRKATNVLLKSNFRFLASDSVRTIEIILEDRNTNTTVCNAVLIDAKDSKDLEPVAKDSKPVNAIQSSPSPDTKTIKVDVIQSILSSDKKIIKVTLRIPDVRGWWSQKKLLLRTSVGVASDEPLSIFTSQIFWVSPRIMSGILSLLILLGFYLLAIWGGTQFNNNGTKLKTSYIFWKLFFHPVALTSGPFGKANLSRFQIFAFTLIILGIVSYIYLRNGVLSPLSNDILLLLGISGTGAVAGKLMQVNKERLSFENWAWLRYYKWLTIGEKGYLKEPKVEDAKWIDLLKVDKFFNVYNFQLAGFSLIVAIHIIMVIVFEFGGSESGLESFALPENFLAVLGFSNVVYIAGRAVEPGSYEELDQKITQLRELADQITPKDDNSLDQSEEYRKYIAQAVVVVEMLKSLYGKEGIFDGKDFQISNLKKPLIPPHDILISSPENQR